MNALLWIEVLAASTTFALTIIRLISHILS
jgi:hypothetical protein